MVCTGSRITESKLAALARPSWIGLVVVGELAPCTECIVDIGGMATDNLHTSCIVVGSIVDHTKAAGFHSSYYSLVVKIVRVVDRNTFAKKWEQKGKNK